MPRQIDFLMTERSMSLDLAGPMDVFITANRFLAPTATPYRNRFVARSTRPLVLTGGIRVVPDAVIGPKLGGDTLVVAGGDNDVIDALASDPGVQRFLQSAPWRYRRVISICNGALVLARAGLLDGRRATTHWEDIPLLKACAPAAQVEDDVLYVQDGAVFTSAGVSAGIDLALHLVEQDHGRSIALKTARQLVVYLHRPGDQRQFSSLLSAQSLNEPFDSLGEWLEKNLARAISLDDMANAVSMSRRNFTRVFRERTGLTPGRFLEQMRVERAGQLLSVSRQSLAQLARRTGFGSEQTLRRAFVRHFGVSPGEYRAHFGDAGNA